jgi:hypothetical protein
MFVRANAYFARSLIVWVTLQVERLLTLYTYVLTNDFRKLQ